MSVEYLGKVQAVCRYPVKSIGGEFLTSARLGWHGIDGDRQYAFYRAANGSRFPWFTGREMPNLVTYAAHYLEPDNPRHSPVRVAIEGGEYDVGDPALRERLSRAVGEDIRLLQVGRGTFDSMPVSVLSTATVALVEARCGGVVDARRYRANILIDTRDGKRCLEVEWAGGTLVFGEAPNPAKLRVNLGIDRCVMITIDPETQSRRPDILRRVVEDFNNRVGVYCATEATGVISVGDRVRWIRSATDFAPKMD